MEATTKKTGSSFQAAKKYFPQPINKAVLFNGNEYKTAAQLMTVAGYGDINKLPFRSLDYNVMCEDYADFLACIKIIGSYNEFDAGIIEKCTSYRLDLRHYLNADNANNGKQLFDFHIARESSPAFYVKYNGKYNNYRITKREPVQASPTQEPGEMLYFEEYTEDDFRENMQIIATEIGADEFNISISYTYSTGENCLTARFWFD